MSKFIPHSKQVQPKWAYMANPKSGEVIRISRNDYFKQYREIDNGFGFTSRDIYERSMRVTYKKKKKGKAVKTHQGAIKESFTPTEYPKGSGRYVPANIYFNIKL